jgi:4-hydroxy-tetrahydrodipicolinate synthase
MKWEGVLPAITTPFREDFSVDTEALRAHAAWMIDTGCAGVVALGSLGEGQVLRLEEKLHVLRTCREALGDRAPVVAGVAALSTAEAVELARAAASVGCDGLMVLPPYVYIGDAAETEAHFRAVISATPLSCMLYNNPVAYGTDVGPELLGSLAAALPNLHAVKESSGDVRRITAITSALGAWLRVLVGLDDLVLEGVAMGAAGWIAGLVNALPEESVRLFELARSGRAEEARRLYEWFLPLLRLDTVPKFVHLIKLVQAEVGRGPERVRPPRLPLAGPERQAALDRIRDCLTRRPGV